MATTQEKVCTLLISFDKQVPPLKELKEKLEKGSDEEKYEALKYVMLMHLNGEPQNKLLMTVIRYVLPSTYRPLKKLLLQYWEMIEKTGRDGKLKEEMILVCSHLRRDLTHPNEYIRGCILRFLCRIKELELLETLVQPIVENLEHRHSYVRRNAVLAVYSIYRLNENLIPDAPELVENFLMQETDIASKRNGFIMLFDCDQERAIRYLRSIMDKISTTGDVFQLVILNLLRKMCKSNPNEKSKYLKVISSLMESKSSAVMYQCAGTLTAVSSSPAAIKASAGCYIRLLLSHTDVNVKLIVLERLVELKNKYPNVMQQIILDLLRGLSCPEMEHKKKILEICMDLVSSRNVEQVTSILKKELSKSHEGEEKDEGKYRQLIVQSLHKCAMKYPEVASLALTALDYISETCGTEVAIFVREIIELVPKLRQQLLSKLCNQFDTITSSRVYRIVLWILGDYSETAEQVEASFNTIKNILSDLLLKQIDHEGSEETSNPTQKSSNTTVSASTSVRPDGTYATQVVETKQKSSKQESKIVNLRTILLDGNFYLDSVVCSTLTKLALRYVALENVDMAARNKMIAEAMYIMCAITRTGLTEKPTYTMDKDTYERITLCLRLLSNKYKVVKNILFEKEREAFANILEEKKEKQKQEFEAEQKERFNQTQPDALLNISQLKGNQFLDAFEFEEEELSRATDNFNKNKQNSSRLSRVIQLTGFSDPVYAEASITINQYDILLDILVVNQTSDTLQNFTLELATIGDLKLCERPQSFSIAASTSQRIKASIKVSSTETGVIFGNIVYDIAGAGNENNCIILNDVHVDIMDYIAPATCDDMQFRNMWFEFEWENKIPVSGLSDNLRTSLDTICKITNTSCLTPESALGGECEFLSANLYARSCFGEDALANVSLEKTSSGKIEGFVRIRSKTQGIALSLGNKIAKYQKKLESKKQEATA